VLYPVSTFLEQLLCSIEHQPLVPIPKIDECSTFCFLATTPFIDFIIRTCRLCAEESTEGLIHSVIALIQMASRFEHFPVGWIVDAGVFEQLAGPSNIQNSLVALIEALPRHPRLHQLVGQLHRQKPNRKRVDRSKILNQLAARRARFEAMVQAELDKIEVDDSADCSGFCHEKIDAETQVFGILWTGRTPPVCGHLSHEQCCRRASHCPICRGAGNRFIPVLVPDSNVFNAQKEMARKTMQKVGCGWFTETVVRAGQLMEFEHSTEVSQALCRLIQTVVTSVDASQVDEPLLVFTATLPPAASFAPPDNVQRKAAAIVWNALGRQNTVDLSAFPSGLPDLALSRMPRQFYEVFQDPQISATIRAIGHGNDCSLCLKCGELTAPDVDEFVEHSIRCCPVALLVTGSLAAMVIKYDSTGFFRRLGALYLTEDGDDDVGLVRGKILFLSEERKNHIMRKFIMGECRFGTEDGMAD
jgi:hypothetical protein